MSLFTNTNINIALIIHQQQNAIVKIAKNGIPKMANASMNAIRDEWQMCGFAVLRSLLIKKRLKGENNYEFNGMG